jgi:hypothetical protein
VHCELVQWLEDSWIQELQLKGANQWAEKPLNTQTKDAAPQEATTVQQSEDHDWECQSVWQRFVKCSHELCVKALYKSNYKSKPCLQQSCNNIIKQSLKEIETKHLHISDHLI